MTYVKSLPVFPAARVIGTLGFMLGAVGGCIGLISMVVWPPDSLVVTLTALLLAPFVAGAGGFTLTAITCYLYNQCAVWMGGIRVELEEAAVASQVGDEETEIRLLSPAVEAEGGGRGTDGKEAAAAVGAAKSLAVYRIRPRPAAKRKAQEGSVAAEPGTGEWIDLRNESPKTLSTRGISLYRVVESGSGGTAEYRFVVSLPDCSLKPEEILRVHSGRRRELSLLPSEDRLGAEWHTFTSEAAYVWADRQGDTALLYEPASKEMIDWASFDANPPEGAVLQRQGAKLVAVSAATAGRR